MNGLPTQRAEIQVPRLTGFLMLVVATVPTLGLIGCGESALDRSPVAGRIGDNLPALEPAAWINDDTQFSPADRAGKVLVVEAFATWCGPCRQMAPAMVQLHQELSKESDESGLAEVQFVSLTPEPTDELDMIREFVADHGVAWPVGIGAESALADLGTEGLPTTWVVGTDGRIVWREVGWSGSGQLSELRAVIDQARRNSTTATSAVP